ncbi:MAG: hypothetical protein [Cotesia congregata filamentous virus 2]
MTFNINNDTIDTHTLDTVTKKINRSLRYRHLEYIKIMDYFSNDINSKTCYLNYEYTINTLNLKNDKIYKLLVDWNTTDGLSNITTSTAINTTNSDNVITDLQHLAINFNNNLIFTSNIYNLLYAIEEYQDYINDAHIDYVLNFDMIDFYYKTVSQNITRAFFTTYPNKNILLYWYKCKFILLDYCFYEKLKISLEDSFFTLEKKIYEIANSLHKEFIEIW